jgi:hypothetical protein
MAVTTVAAINDVRITITIRARDLAAAAVISESRGMINNSKAVTVAIDRLEGRISNNRTANRHRPDVITIRIESRELFIYLFSVCVPLIFTLFLF